MSARRSSGSRTCACCAGEGGIIPVGGVIANAVASALGALGVVPRELPLSPPRIWKMIQDARAP